MKGLILVAHGSRVPASNEEVRRLADALRTKVEDRFQWVEAAFLELAQPSIAEAVDMAIAAGAGSVVVLPYFLAAGKHVSQDIPAIIKNCQAAHPDSEIRIADYLGRQPALLDLLAGAV